jgi:hypothetical protein
MPAELQPDPPPDWSTLDKDLHCPLCEYNLRGLTESRCPECGFAFTWAELLDALKNKHPYLFEYGRGRNVKTFWTTFWRTCLPRRFWREVNPAQDVKVGRLILYWVIARSLLGLIAVVPYAKSISTVTVESLQFRSRFKPVPGSPGMVIPRVRYGPGGPIPINELDREAPLPWQSGFWGYVSEEIDYNAFGFMSWIVSVATTWAAIYLGWPWLTLISLLIFRMSMRQAKIKTVHVLWTVIYSCDFTISILIAIAGVYWFQNSYDRGWLYVAMAGVCAVITSYRLSIAFQRYVRVHLPLATVLASQAIAFMVVFVLLIQIADFFRRI